MRCTFDLATFRHLVGDVVQVVAFEKVLPIDTTRYIAVVKAVLSRPTPMMKEEGRTVGLSEAAVDTN